MIVMFQDSPSFFHQSSPTGRPILFIAEGKRYMRPLFQGPGCLLCNYAQPSLFLVHRVVQALCLGLVLISMLHCFNI